MAGRSGGEVDGFRIGYVPDGVGELVSDFASEWEDVRFTTRVWERQVDDGYRVDLRVHVLRGDGLTSLDEVRDVLAGYQERDPAQWPLTEFRQPRAAAPGAEPAAGPGGGPADVIGLFGEGEAFWLAGPGVAGYVLADPERVDTATLLAIVASIVPSS
ncbi:hypothetical protein [Micromonospora rosaria]|uniref:hypothetical protein n=1 Tax=Micromonospora rosaria TaxID=47874 RepID=UPI001FE0FEF0|nr:hypothetical protein [Micromonospora rosaria]